MKRTHSLLMAALACGAATPNLSSAQSLAPNSDDAAATNNAPIRLPAVTVVAQKEAQLADALPVSITAVTIETLQEAAIHAVKEASVYAPNTFINEFSARALSNPFFRGIGGGPLNPGVTTFIDGVPQLNTYSANVELVDVNQIE